MEIIGVRSGSKLKPTTFMQIWACNSEKGDNNNPIFNPIIKELCGD